MGRNTQWRNDTITTTRNTKSEMFDRKIYEIARCRRKNVVCFRTVACKENDTTSDIGLRIVQKCKDDVAFSEIDIVHFENTWKGHIIFSFKYMFRTRHPSPVQNWLLFFQITTVTVVGLYVYNSSVCYCEQIRTDTQMYEWYNDHMKSHKT